MNMTPTERKDAEALLKNGVISEATRDLIKHALACNDSECDRCAKDWRTKGWVREDQREDLDNTTPTTAKPGTDHRL